MATENPKWVRAWIMKFLAEHADRVNRTDWPPFERPDAASGSIEIDPFWDAWIWGFITRGGVTYDLATAASRKVAANPPDYLDKQLKGLLDAIESIELGKLAEATNSTREDAFARSKDCRDCAGSGFAIRYSHGDGEAKVPAGYSFTLFCGCAMGKFLAARNLGESSKRPVTVDQVASLRLEAVPWSDQLDNKYRYRLQVWESIHCEFIATSPLRSEVSF